MPIRRSISGCQHWPYFNHKIGKNGIHFSTDGIITGMKWFSWLAIGGTRYLTVCGRCNQHWRKDKDKGSTDQVGRLGPEPPLHIEPQMRHSNEDDGSMLSKLFAAQAAIRAVDTGRYFMVLYHYKRPRKGSKQTGCPRHIGIVRCSSNQRCHSTVVEALNPMYELLQRWQSRTNRRSFDIVGNHFLREVRGVDVNSTRYKL